MLYKKYHRNFVKQFKKGAKVMCIKTIIEVTKEPYLPNFSSSRIDIEDGEYIWTLVHSGGRVNRYLHVI